MNNIENQNRKPNGFWNEQTCREEASKYRTRVEFQKNSSRAYSVALKNGWIDTYTWFVYSRTGKKWIEESCREEAKKYTCKKEFSKGSIGAYEVAVKNGWIDTYDWFKRPEPQNKKWNAETCREESRKYSSRGEFAVKSVGAYVVARKNGWLEEYIWLENKNLFSETGRRGVVYIYRWESLNAVYVGLSINPKDRHRQHLKNQGGNDTPYMYSKENGLEIPAMEILEDKLTPIECKQKEIYYIDYFKGIGYNVINKAKGGSVGGFASGKWNKESCYKEAKKYSTKVEFEKANSSAYKASIKNGWIEDYDWFVENKKPGGYWNEETCREEALKYKTRKQLQKGCSRCYQVAMLNGWIDSYEWLEASKTAKKWTEETCKDEAKKYKTRNAFKEGNGSAYLVASRNGWLDSYDWFEEIKKQKNYWNEETCREEAKKYTSIVAFQKGASRAYEVSRNNGWIETYTWFSRPENKNKKWNEETCREESKKYGNRKAFADGCNRAYTIALKNGWLDDYTWLEQSRKPRGYWTEERCYEEAMKYISRTDFSTGSRGAYNVARRNGWLEKYDWLIWYKKGYSP